MSQRQKARIVGNYNGKSSRIELTREKFHEITKDLVQRCSALCGVVLSEAQMTWGDIDAVLLVGGSTRMPMIQEMIAEISGKDINPSEVNPDDAVALGAAIQGTLRQIEEGTTGVSNTAMVESLPDAVKDRFIGPGGDLTVKVTDGATHHLGTVIFNERDEERIYVMIPKMTPIPCEKSDRFGTRYDNQTSVVGEIVQGLEHDQLRNEIPENAFEDFKIGECRLELPPGLPAGAPIDVIYKYNLDQTLEVIATGPDGRTAKVTINRSTLDETEVAEATEMVKNLEVE